MNSETYDRPIKTFVGDVNDISSILSWLRPKCSPLDRCVERTLSSLSNKKLCTQRLSFFFKSTINRTPPLEDVVDSVAVKERALNFICFFAAYLPCARCVQEKKFKEFA